MSAILENHALLIFEGLDKTGKTTVRHEILKQTNRFIIWDRGMASQYVYGKLFNKDEIPLQSLRIIENSLLYGYIDHLSYQQKRFPVYYVYFYTIDDELLKLRMEVFKEDKKIIENIQRAKDLYFEYFYNCNITVITIDTTSKTVKSAAKEVITKIDKLLKEEFSNV